MIGAAKLPGEIRVAVVTVTFNSEKVLGDFLDSIAAQTFRNFILIVVDNASIDRSVFMVKDRGARNYEVIGNAHNLGVAEANNQGIRRAIESGCTHVLLLNNDTTFGPTMFQQLVTAGAQHPIVVPKIYFHDLPSVLWYAGGTFKVSHGYTGVHIGEGVKDLGQYNVPLEVMYSPTCCMLIAIDVFSKIGMMDARYFVYGDDSDFCFRLWRSGRLIWYAPTITMTHKVGSLTGGELSPFSARMGVRNKVYFWKKSLPRFAALYFCVTYFVYLLCRLIVRRDSWRRFKLKVAAFREGLQVSDRPPLVL